MIARAALTTPSRSSIERALSPVDQAYGYILDGILSGSLEPGMRIPTETVADVLGISRMPVRDALRRLEGDGVVSILANRGASIAEYSHDEVIELTEMRAALEALAARVALSRIEDAELAELVHLKQRMERAAPELTGWIAQHDAFHNYLTALSGRPILMRQTERIRLMLRPYFQRYVAESDEQEIGGLEHQRIIDAIARRDADALEQTVRAHAQVNAPRIAAFARRR